MLFLTIYQALLPCESIKWALKFIILINKVFFWFRVRCRIAHLSEMIKK